MTKIRSPKPLASSESERLHPTIPRDTLVARNHNHSARVGRKPRKVISAAEAHQRHLEREEMHSLLAKLKQLVPGIPKNRKLSTLKIIQHVIDYIFDLQVALESHPISLGAGPVDFFNELTSSTARLCQITEMSSSSLSSSACVTQRIPSLSRQPLASITL